ncbi:hypothetical protein [Natrinema sp. CGMCC1.2065]|uniref:hypothetical protein n=1 Tax=Natrinema sp. CGMCC1.2065 TaxID=3445767 RepID=UPI003F49B8FE
MNGKLESWISEAIDCHDDDGVIRNENISRIERLMPLIVKEIPIDRHAFRVSEETIEGKIRSLLQEVHDDPNPIDEFENRLSNIQRDLGISGKNYYTVAFPLNIKFSAGDEPQVFDMLNSQVKRIGRNKWRQDYANPAKDNDHKLERFLKKSPNDLDTLNHTYWKVTYRAGDERYAVNKVSEIINLLCGKINYSIYYKRAQGMSVNSGPWVSGWADLRSPFVYLVFEDGYYNSYHYSRDPSPRKTTRVTSQKRRRYDAVMPEIPDFGQSPNKVDDVIISGFQLFQSAIAEPDLDEAFLHYWRAVETLTMTNPEERLGKIPERAKALIEPKNPKLFDDRLERVRNMRNKLVHEGVDVHPEKEDLNLLKTLLESLIKFFIDFRNDWDYDDFRFILDTASTDKHGLQQMKSHRKREVELIDQLLTHKSI